jgi:NAD(P)-dependent dehydrogenase (short-subunit alcohol dehydrogenase family)
MSVTTVIAGVGPGLGAALTRRFSASGGRVAMLARSESHLRRMAAEFRGEGRDVVGLPVDLARPNQVARAFEAVRHKWGGVDNLIYNASETAWKGLLQLSPGEFEHAWRACVYGAFLCSREAARHMVRRRAGAMLFTGATSSVRGRKGAVDFSSAKFALRGLVESLARELWPKGIHVAHVVIDGMIDTPAVRKKYHPKKHEPLLKPEAIAETFWELACQRPSAWTLELDLRPYNEDFFV